MFLKDFEKPKRLKQALFFEYAMLAALSEGNFNDIYETDEHKPETSDIDDSWFKIKKHTPTSLAASRLEIIIEHYESKTNKSDCKVYEKISKRMLKNGINEKEKSILESYVNDNLCHKFLTHHFDLDFLSYDLSLTHSTSNFDKRLFRFPTVLGAIQKCLPEIIEKYSKDENIKKQLIEKVMAEGGDLMDLQDENMLLSIVSFPKALFEILTESAKLLFESKKDDLGYFTERERKIIIFELISIGFCSGRIEKQKIKLIRYICELLDIDNDYFEEFINASNRFFEAKNEIVELINE
ncbi:MAG: hypothetical protein KGV46_01765 [Pasteurella sp.]|nr:hypothetical protein [Pasteurella sp.]